MDQRITILPHLVDFQPRRIGESPSAARCGQGVDQIPRPDARVRVVLQPVIVRAERSLELGPKPDQKSGLKLTSGRVEVTNLRAVRKSDTLIGHRDPQPFDGPKSIIAQWGFRGQLESSPHRPADQCLSSPWSFSIPSAPGFAGTRLLSG